MQTDFLTFHVYLSASSSTASQPDEAISNTSSLLLYLQQLHLQKYVVSFPSPQNESENTDFVNITLNFNYLSHRFD
jgi:hypothetical protein